jgi:hypothetical protein
VVTYTHSQQFLKQMAKPIMYQLSKSEDGWGVEALGEFDKGRHEMNLYQLIRSDGSLRIAPLNSDVFDERLWKTQEPVKASSIGGLKFKICLIEEAILEMKRCNLKSYRLDDIPPHAPANSFKTLDEFSNYFEEIKKNCISYVVHSYNLTDLEYIEITEIPFGGFF